MMKRTLALSFVATVGGCREPEPVHANPPPMEYCQDKQQVGAACDTGRECFLRGREDECGLNGYRCRDGKWEEMMTFCNPPPPR